MTRVFLFLAAAMMVTVVALVAAVRYEGADSAVTDHVTNAVGVREWACPSGTVGRTTCKYVSVPENYDDPEIEQIDLFVSVITPPLETDSVPILYIGSELGGSAVERFGDWNVVARQTRRQIVLMDLRGSGLSQPRTGCGGRLTSQPWLEAKLEGRELLAAETDVENALLACRRELSDAFEFSAYSLDSVARDIDVVRERLGIEEWVIAAAGEATQVARRAEQIAPDRVASMVLLGATASTADRHVAQYGYANEVLDEVLDETQQQLLDDAVESLDNRTVEFAVGTGGRTRRVAVGKEIVRPVLARAVTDERVRELLPALLEERFPAGQWRIVASLRNSQYRPSGSWSAGIAMSVLCGDASLDDAVPLSEAIDDFDPTWRGLIDDPTLHPTFCAAWDPPTHATLDDPPTAPTLVVNGRLDVAAPSSAAEEIDERWPDAEVLSLPDRGQPVIFDACVTDIVAAYLDATATATATMNSAASCA